MLQTKDRGDTVKFSQLVDFVKKEAKKANDPTFGRDAIVTDYKEPERKAPRSSATSQRAKGSFATSVSEPMQNSRQLHAPSGRPRPYMSCSASSVESRRDSPKPVAHAQLYTRPADIAFKKPCLYCDNDKHSLSCCDKLYALVFSDRINFLKGKGLCYGCLKPGHQRRLCRYRATCDHCQLRHPTVLHMMRSQDTTAAEGDVQHHHDDNTPAKTKAYFTEKFESHMGAGMGDCTFSIIPVNVRMKNCINTVSTYAFLDNGSNVNFCSEGLMNRLGAHGKKMNITVDTMGKSHNMSTYAVSNLEVCDLQNVNSVELNSVYTKDTIPASSNHIPKEEDLVQWPHLDGISLPQIDATVELLIGNQVADAYTPIEIRTGPRGSPNASRTILEWVIWNLVRDSDLQHLSTNRADVAAIQNLEEDRRLEQMLQKSFKIDFPERTIDDKKEDSIEDQKFLMKINNSIKLVDGHYQMGLPFRNQDVKLPHNRQQAIQRLGSLQRKLLKDQELRADYIDFMNAIINNGYAEEVPHQELSRSDGRVWYIPHHGVYNPHKPDKIRVVFDCVAPYHGVSLNNLLLQGPDLTNSLLGVLLKFREEQVAVMSDIESMFYQVRVCKDDIDCLRFFWWPHGVISGEPQEYRMLVHLFGATSSPACSNIALRSTAEDNSHLFPTDVCNKSSRIFMLMTF